MRYNEGKEIITHESIHADILKKLKKEREMWISTIVFFAIFGAFFGFTVGSAINNFAELIYLHEGVFAFVFSIAAIAYFVVRVIRVQKKCTRVQNKEYSILEDTVYRIADDEYVGFENKWQRFFSPTWSKADREYVDVIYFETLGRLVSTQNVLDYTLPGDVFYVVVFNTKCEPPIIAYSKKIYEFKDN